MTNRLGAQPHRALIIACTLYALSLILIDESPFLVGLYVDSLHISISDAGVVQTIDQAGGIGGAVLGFMLMPRVGWGRLMLGACLAATIANALTGLAHDYLTLCIIRFVAGFSVVLLTTVSACVLARVAVPDRAFGAGMAIAMLLSAVAIWLLDLLRARIGFGAALSSGALWLGIGVILALLFPKDVSGSEVRPVLEAGSRQREDEMALGKAGLLALLLFAVGANVVSGFTERVGLANGMTPGQVANASAISYILSTAAALIPTVVGVVGGRLKWLGLTTILFFGAMGALYTAATVPFYAFAFATYLATWSLGLTYYMSLIADNDPNERFTRMIYIVNVAAQSAGPAMGAALLARNSLNVVLIVAPLPAAAAFILVAVYAARRSRAEAQELVLS